MFLFFNLKDFISNKGSRKKSSFFSGSTTKRGVGVRARPLRKKELFKKHFFLFVALEKKVPNDL